MAYSGQAEQIFQEALLSAFPSQTALQQFVSVLDVNLEEVTRRGNLRDVVYDLVRWADREGRLASLVEAAEREQEHNPVVREAVRYVRDKDRIEDRWYAKHVPLVTWLLGAVNVGLFLVVVKVGLANLINTTRLLLGALLLLLVLVALRLLYNKLAGGPVRARVLNLFRRLIAHSRLGRREWLAFAGMLAALMVQTSLIASVPDPMQLRFDAGPVAGYWKDNEFALLETFPNSPSEMELQGPDRAGLRDPERFARTFYRVELYVAPQNLAQKLKVQVGLTPTAHDMGGRALAEGPPSVTFADLAIDRALAAVVADEQHRLKPDRGRASEVGIELQVSVDEMKGRRSILFTCQRMRDGQPTPTEVNVYARILDENDGVLFRTSGTFSIDDWHPDRRMASSPDRRSDRRAASRGDRWTASVGTVGALSGVRVERPVAARSGFLR
jgi:hypothetical protein